MSNVNNKMRPIEEGYHCWVTNLTKMKIVLGDLKLTLQPYKTLDILDKRHSNLTLEEVAKSIQSGSIYKKWQEKKISFREKAPTPKNDKKIELSKVSFPYKYRQYSPVEQKVFSEFDLDFDTDKFAELNADASEIEHEPQINLRKQLNNEESNKKVD